MRDEYDFSGGERGKYFDRVAIGACKHGKAIHYRYPCRRCLGWRGYLRQRFWAWRNDTWKRLKRRLGL